MASKTKRAKKTEIVDTPVSTPRKIRRGYILFGLLALAFLGYMFRGLFVAAMVNGRPITRLSVIKQLETEGGKQILEAAVTQALIETEAAKAGVSVSADDVDAEISSIASDMGVADEEIDNILAAQGLTREGLREQIKVQLLVEGLIGGVTVTEEEISEFLTANAESIPEGSSEEDNVILAREQLEQQKLSTEIQSWLAAARESASIKYFVEYGL